VVLVVLLVLVGFWKKKTEEAKQKHSRSQSCDRTFSAANFDNQSKR
jgi:hypothetical protein